METNETPLDPPLYIYIYIYIAIAIAIMKNPIKCDKED